MKRNHSLVSVLLLVLCVMLATVHAEEGGSGHYMPGSMASFVDGVPAGPTFITRLNYVNYSGDFNRALMGGLLALNADAKSEALGLTVLWSPEKNLKGKWNYAMSATIPVVSIDVSADINGVIHRNDSETGLGDVFLLPVMLNYQLNEDLGFNFRMGVYTPTGEYKVGRLANPGKNFWTIEPTAALLYFGKKNGREAALFLGMDYNTENNDTNYKSGSQAHVEGTLAQHFPLWKGVAGVGITGFYYQQLTKDSGEGATLGDFKARALGIGPALSYITKIAGHDLSVEAKWLNEFETNNRLEGNTFFLKVVAFF